MTARIHLGDCREMLGQMPSNSVDCVVTDPPYGMSYRSGRRAEKFDAIAGDEDPELFVSVLPEIARVLRPDRHVYVFCSWHHLDTFLGQMRAHFTVKNLIVWNKNVHGSGDLKGAYAPKHEFIVFAHKGRRELTRRIPDVIDCPKVPGGAMVHPTEKPVNLLRTLIANSTTAGETVLDPFTGGGSTGLAAAAEGRRFIGCELAPAYHAIAEARINNALYSEFA